MNRSGTKVSLLGVKGAAGRRRRLATTLAIAVGMLVSAAAVAPSATATAGALAGTWTSIDLDGSNQTLKIKGAGNPVYSTFFRDDFTSGACGGPPAKLVGHARANGNELLMRGTLVCLHRGNPIPGVHVVFSLEYDPSNDTLTDDSGVVWERAG